MHMQAGQNSSNEPARRWEGLAARMRRYRGLAMLAGVASAGLFAIQATPVTAAGGPVPMGFLRATAINAPSGAVCNTQNDSAAGVGAGTEICAWQGAGNQIDFVYELHPQHIHVPEFNNQEQPPPSAASVDVCTDLSCEHVLAQTLKFSVPPSTADGGTYTVRGNWTVSQAGAYTVMGLAWVGAGTVNIPVGLTLK